MFADFTPGWYASIGSSLVLTCLSQALQPPIMSALAGWFSHLVMPFRQKRCFTQDALNSLLEGPEWSLGVRVAQTLNALWLSFSLSGGIPCLGLLPPLTLLLSYLSDKYFLLYVSSRPPNCSMVLPRTCLVWLLWGVWIHCALTFWMYGTPALPAFESKKGAALELVPSGNAQFDIAARLARWQSLVQAVLLFTLTAYLVLIRPLLPSRKAALTKEGTDVELEDALRSDCWRGLRSYDFRENPRYRELLTGLSRSI